MDENTKRLMVNALRNPANQQAFNTLNTPERTPDNLPYQLGVDHYSNPAPAQYILPSASGEDLGYGSIDINRDRLSLQKDGKIGDGSYYAEVNKPFNGDVNARLRYLLPHKNGYFEADGNLQPGNSSLFVNYKTNF